MLEKDKDGNIKSVCPIEDICNHCKLIESCKPYNIEGIFSENPNRERTYLVECSKFKSAEGIYKVKLEPDYYPDLV